MQKFKHRSHTLWASAIRISSTKNDKLHQEGKSSWTTEATPHGYPVFVVWRTIYHPGREPERKGRVVVDIRGLNKIAQPDSYPMQQQSNITSAVQGCKYITTVDCSGFFHQWKFQTTDRPKFTIVSHQGSEHFNVAVGGSAVRPPMYKGKLMSYFVPTGPIHARTSMTLSSQQYFRGTRCPKNDDYALCIRNEMFFLI